MRLGLLGPVAAWAEDGPLDLGPPLQRAVLAVLASQPGRAVSTATLADLLWGDEPPRSARKNLQIYVSRLRRALGPALESAPPGYRLAVPDDAVDQARFETLVRQARDARRAGRLAEAA
ncbi:MAG TPA: winged helix-turn-helix domain-containing protein, partial [Pseudonocardiaceae bacterium]